MRDILLKLLNWLEDTPSSYARIDNVNFYSKDFLESFDKHKTLGKFLKEMKLMDDCMKSGENCLIVNGKAFKGVELTKFIE